MKFAVRYYTKGGNTKKLADAVAEVIGVEAKTVDIDLEEPVDVLFLGSSVYAAGVDSSVIKFIEQNKIKIGKIVNVSTAAILPSTYKQVKKLAAENNVTIDDKEFHCRGSFGAMHKGRPNEADLEEAKKFAKEFLQ